MSLRNSRRAAVALVTLACFTDITAYSIAIPVLPDLSRRLGASPTMIGFLFASFGVTLLTVSIPMGAISDRIGRKGPMVGGLIALAAATLLFAFADGLPWLFAARLVQGAADAVTWVVGFALIADLYDVNERGRVTGMVMMGTSVAVLIGPTFGGWLYELGGIRLPFIAVAALAVVDVGLFLGLEVPRHHAPSDHVPLGMVLRVPAIAACALVVVGISATISMLEPVLALQMSGLGVRPARLGLIYGAAAVVTTALNPVCGRLSDRVGARRLTMIGLLMTGCMIPILGQAWSYSSALVLFVICAASATFVITPSLAYMGEATSVGFSSNTSASRGSRWRGHPF
jgi:multidrug resistance protein